MTATLEKVRNFTDEEIIEADKYLCQTSLKHLCTKKLGFGDWDVCHDKLETFLKDSKKNRVLILFPREHLKTSIVTIGYTLQQILINPNISVLFANEILGNAVKFLGQLKGYLETKSDLPALFGKFEGSLWNQDEIVILQRTVVDKTPTVSTSGVEGTTVSQHYDLIVLDDILSRKTINTAEQIQKTRDYYSDAQDLLKKPNGKLIIVGTRWDDKDL